MEFRLAKFEELPLVQALYHSVIGSKFCTWDEDYPGSEDINADYGNSALFVLTEGSSLLGAVSIVPKNELEELDCWHCRENTAELARVVVAPSMQGKGLSKRLVTEAENLLRQRGVKVVHLLAAVKNIPANRCYASCGYVRYGVIPMYDNLYYPCEKLLNGEKL